MRVFLLQSGLWQGDVKGFKVSLGLAYLGAYLKTLGHQVAAIDLNYPTDLVTSTPSQKFRPRSRQY
jgi:hypothetical protein